MRGPRIIPITWLLAVVALQPMTAVGQAADSTIVCAPATAEAFLDVGNVRAKIMNNGGLFWNGGSDTYEIPKGSGLHSVFAASLWLGGLVDEELHMAATTYGPWEFWPGPVTESGPLPESCAQYDRIWSLGIEDFGSDGYVSNAVVDWPARAGAPFIDVDGDGQYRPENGDRPELLGDQQLWWIMNDAGAPHANTKSDPMGLEVRATAFAFGEEGAVGNSTFYRYQIRNTSAKPIYRAFAGLFVDSDLGAAFDDYVGSDTLLGSGYFFNADDHDDGNYGTAPPALGVMALMRPRSDLLSDHPDCRYPDDKLTGFTNTMYFNSGGGRTGDPVAGENYYNIIQSRWTNGRPLTSGGNGYGISQEATRFVYPGDPVLSQYWSEMNTDVDGHQSPPSERRMVNGLGPFCIVPGEEVELVIAIVWSRGSSNLDSVRKLKEDMAYIQSIREVILTPRSIPDGYIPDPEVPFAVGVYPNPAGADGVTVRLSLPERMGTRVEVYDALGRRVHVAASTAVRSSGDHLWTLPTGTWAPGVYLVRIQAGSAVTTRRLVVTSGT